MNNERYNQIIYEAYRNYKILTHKENERNHPMKYVSGVNHFTETSFIQMCKIDSDFSKKWGLKIEERELSQHERVKLLQEAWKNNGIVPEHEEVSTLWVEYNNLMTKYNIPDKLITITYKGKKTEVYE